MELLLNDEYPGDTEQLLYEKVEDFKFLGATQFKYEKWLGQGNRYSDK